MDVRRYLIRSLPLLAAVVAGAVILVVAGDSRTLLVIGLALVMTASVLLSSLFFYEVGRSEDRDRAAERARRSSPQ